jgi:hypothetical protein
MNSRQRPLTQAEKSAEPCLCKIGYVKSRYIGGTPSLKVNPEATCESRESVETTREKPKIVLDKLDGL